MFVFRMIDGRQLGPAGVYNTAVFDSVWYTKIDVNMLG